MKKKIMPLLLMFTFVLFTVVSMAQPKPEEQGKDGTVKGTDPGDGPGNGDTPIGGGGAPIDGGLFLLIGLGAAYGSKKVYKMYGENK